MSLQHIAGVGWSGQVEANWLETMGQTNQAFRMLATMLHGVIRGANNYQQQDRISQQAVNS